MGKWYSLTDEDEMPFGKKHKGKKMKDVPDSYLRWMYNEAGLPDGNLKEYIERRFNIAKEEDREIDFLLQIGAKLEVLERSEFQEGTDCIATVIHYLTKARKIKGG